MSAVDDGWEPVAGSSPGDGWEPVDPMHIPAPTAQETSDAAFQSGKMSTEDTQAYLQAQYKKAPHPTLGSLADAVTAPFEAAASTVINSVAPIGAGVGKLFHQDRSYHDLKDLISYNSDNPNTKALLEGIGQIPGLKQIGQGISSLGGSIADYSGLTKEEGTDIVGGVGAALTGGAGLLKAGASNLVKSTIANSLKGGGWQEPYTALQKVLPDLKLDLGQMTDNPTVVNYLRGSPSPVKQKFWADQSNALVEDMKRRLTQNGVAGDTSAFLPDVLKQTQELYDSHIDAATAARSAAWKDSVANFEKSSESLGSIEAPTLFSKADELLSAEVDKIRNPGGFNIGAGVKNALSDIKGYLAPTKPLTAAQQQVEGITKGMSADARQSVYNQLGESAPPTGSSILEPRLPMSKANDALVGIRKIIESDDPQARQLGGQLFDSLLTDLKNGAGNSPALQDLLDLRNAYKQHSNNIQAMRDSTTAQVLGAGKDNLLPSQLDTGADIYRNFLKAQPEQQADSIAWIQKNNPEAIPQLRTRVVQDAVDSATSKTPVGITTSRVNLTDLSASLNKMGQYDGLWSPPEKATISALGDALGTIRRTNTGSIASTGAADSMTVPYIAARAAKGSLAFGIKLAMKIAGHSGSLENAVLNPNMQWLASRVSKAGVAGKYAARQAMLGYMSNALDSGELSGNGTQQQQQQSMTFQNPQ